MIRVVPRNFEEDYDENLLVTSPDPIVGNTEVFSETGIFSERIFGKLANGVEYSCKCNKFEGEFNKDVVCDVCKVKVQFMGLNLRKEGWIDLVIPCFHPLLFRYVRKVIGSMAVDKILNYKARISKNGITIEPEFVFPYEGIGILKFIDNFEEVLNSFVNKKNKKNPPNNLIKDYNFILANKDILFVSKFPVVNVKLRPALMIGDTLDYHEMNNHYNGLIKNSNVLRSLNDLELKNINTVIGLVSKNQELINTLSESLVNEMSNKEGCIRNSILGSRLNFTSRAVITPLSGEYKMDSIVISYLMGMELFKPIILQKLRKLKNISLFKANKLWSSAVLKFDNLFHTIMTEIIKSPNVKILLNRNPTISVGSMLLLDIDSIKTDISDVTSSIPNLILSLISGDYDGDVLNHVALFGKEFIDLFQGMRPSKLVLDLNTGDFNRNFLPMKDIAWGMQSLLF